MLASDAPGFVARIIDDAASEFLLALVDDADDIAALERATYFSDARRQQTCLAFNERAARALVHHQRRFHRRRKGNPAALARQSRLRQKQGADFFAGKDAREDA